MMQEDKELLLKDLCARLPYKPFAQWHHKASNEFRDVKIMKISTYGKNIDDYYINVLCQPEPGVDYEVSIVDIKPYLRSISSMTEEEKGELKLEQEKDEKLFIQVINKSQNGDDSLLGTVIPHCAKDWANKNHFDYRGLIPKGLALEAPEGMYKHFGDMDVVVTSVKHKNKL